MKLMFASDIHGSALWCAKMLDAYRAEAAERLVVLGDILYHGPRNDLPEGYDPKAVITQLNAMAGELVCVRGNCDAEVDQMVLTFPILADYALLFDEGRMFYITHGHVYNTAALPPMKAGDVLIHGHTHVPAWEEFGEGNLYLNPGSVSIPKSGSCHGYMIYEDGEFIWKDFDGEIYHRLKL